MKIFPFLIGLLVAGNIWVFAADFYALRGGDDPSTDVVELTLTVVNNRGFDGGDRILFKQGEVYSGRLVINEESGRSGNPVLVTIYGESSVRLLITDGVDITGSEFLAIEGLEITGRGVEALSWWGSEFNDVYLLDLHIHNVSGTGINFIVANENAAHYNGIHICGCLIENATGYGITINKQDGDNPPNATFHENARICNNVIRNVRKAGMQVCKIRNVLIAGNHVSFVGNDENGNGSGLWTWYCEDALIQYNVFMDGRGVTDACGVHIDIRCVNHVVQYNLSMNNEGGLAQILGRAWNWVCR